MTIDTPTIAELGHVGIRCFDLSRQLEFYTGTLGLTVTDHDEERGLWFLSARPDIEHHELLLTSGREGSDDVRLIQQISFRCDTLESVTGFLRKFRTQGVAVDMVVSHGNAVGVYFYDPEGNRGEVYWHTGLTARQPFVEHIDLDVDTDLLLERIRRSVHRHGEAGIFESPPDAGQRRP